MSSLWFAAAFRAAAVSDERIVSRREVSDFQILAHFAQTALIDGAAHFRGRAAEFAAEGVGEMAMAGEAQFQGERGQIIRAISQPLQRGAQPQTRQIAMKRRAGSLLEEAGQVKRRGSNGSRYVVECDAFRYSAGQISLRPLDAVGVIGFRAIPAAPRLSRRYSMPRKRGFQSVGDELKRRHVNP